MKFFMLLVSAFLLLSCGSGLPTEEMAYEKLNSKVPEKDKPLYEYLNFKKTNGVEGEFAGQKFYQIDYTVDKVAKQDIKGRKNIIGKIDFQPDSTAIADSVKWNESYVKRFGGPPVQFDKSFKKGESIEVIKSSIRFIKKENGWE